MVAEDIDMESAGLLQTELGETSPTRRNGSHSDNDDYDLDTGTGGGRSNDNGGSQKRPKLFLLVVSYFILIQLFIIEAIFLIVAIYNGATPRSDRHLDEWRIVMWVMSVLGFGVTVHLLMAIMKVYNPFTRHLRPLPKAPSSSHEPDAVSSLPAPVTSTSIVSDTLNEPHPTSPSPFAHLFNFGQPEIYSRIQTHVGYLFVWFVLWGMFALNVHNLSDPVKRHPGINRGEELIPWSISIISFMSCTILYATAWKIIEVHPTWTYTHIVEIDRVTGAGKVRI